MIVHHKQRDAYAKTKMFTAVIRCLSRQRCALVTSPLFARELCTTAEPRRLATTSPLFGLQPQWISIAQVLTGPMQYRQLGETCSLPTVGRGGLIMVSKLWRDKRLVMITTTAAAAGTSTAVCRQCRLRLTSMSRLSPQSTSHACGIARWTRRMSCVWSGFVSTCAKTQ